MLYDILTQIRCKASFPNLTVFPALSSLWDMPNPSSPVSMSKMLHTENWNFFLSVHDGTTVGMLKDQNSSLIWFEVVVQEDILNASTRILSQAAKVSNFITIQTDSKAIRGAIVEPQYSAWKFRFSTRRLSRLVSDIGASICCHHSRDSSRWSHAAKQLRVIKLEEAAAACSWLSSFIVFGLARPGLWALLLFSCPGSGIFCFWASVGPLWVRSFLVASQLWDSKQVEAIPFCNVLVLFLWKYTRTHLTSKRRVNEVRRLLQQAFLCCRSFGTS